MKQNVKMTEEKLSFLDKMDRYLVPSILIRIFIYAGASFVIGIVFSTVVVDFIGEIDYFYPLVIVFYFFSMIVFIIIDFATWNKMNKQKEFVPEEKLITGKYKDLAHSEIPQSKASIGQTIDQQKEEPISITAEPDKVSMISHPQMPININLSNIGNIGSTLDQPVKKQTDSVKSNEITLSRSVKIGIRYISCTFESDQDEAEWHFDDLRKLVRRFIAEIPIEDKPSVRKKTGYLKLSETLKSRTDLLVYLEVTFKNGITLTKITFKGGELGDAKDIQLIVDILNEEVILIKQGDMIVVRCLGCGAPLERLPDEEELYICPFCETSQRIPKRKT